MQTLDQSQRPSELSDDTDKERGTDLEHSRTNPTFLYTSLDRPKKSQNFGSSDDVPTITPHPVITFGFGGKLVVIFSPAISQKNLSVDKIVPQSFSDDLPETHLPIQTPNDEFEFPEIELETVCYLMQVETSSSLEEEFTDEPLVEIQPDNLLDLNLEISLSLSPEVQILPNEVFLEQKPEQKCFVFDLHRILQDTHQVKSFKSYPGPLLPSTPLDDIIRFVNEEIQLGSSFKGNEQKILLWDYLRILLTSKGKERFSQVSQLLKKEPTTQTPPLLIMNHTEETSPTQSIDTPNFVKLLMFGQEKEACSIAIQNKQWVDALILTSHFDPLSYQSTLAQFASTCVEEGGPLRTYFLMLSGHSTWIFSSKNQNKPPPVVNRWRENLQVFLSNFVSYNKDVNGQLICQLGDLIWTWLGDVDLAHFCYLLAEEFFHTTLSDSRLTLIGSDHRKCTKSFAGVTPFQMSEIYERLKENKSSTLIEHKLRYAYYLADYGLLEQSIDYLEAIRSSVSPKDTPLLHSLFNDLHSRLLYHTKNLETTQREQKGWWRIFEKLPGLPFSRKKNDENLPPIIHPRTKHTLNNTVPLTTQSAPTQLFETSNETDLAQKELTNDEVNDDVVEDSFEDELELLRQPPHSDDETRDEVDQTTTSLTSSPSPSLGDEKEESRVTSFLFDSDLDRDATRTKEPSTDQLLEKENQLFEKNDLLPKKVETKTASSWGVSSILSRFFKRKNRVHLPSDEVSYVFDKVKNKWVKKGEEDVQEKGPAPPPTDDELTRELSSSTSSMLPAAPGPGGPPPLTPPLDLNSSLPISTPPLSFSGPGPTLGSGPVGRGLGGDFGFPPQTRILSPILPPFIPPLPISADDPHSPHPSPSPSSPPSVPPTPTHTPLSPKDFDNVHAVGDVDGSRLPASLLPPRAPPPSPISIPNATFPPLSPSSPMSPLSAPAPGDSPSVPMILNSPSSGSFTSTPMLFSPPTATKENTMTPGGTPSNRFSRTSRQRSYASNFGGH